MRRAFDITAALVLLLLTFPLLMLAGMAVLIISGRPIFFGHVRVGRNGALFRCWKLRTMQNGAERALHETPHLRANYEANGYKLPLAHDPRVTRVGRWLRRTYIDELPQLFNVLNGTMSVVGPRPVVPAQFEAWRALCGDTVDELFTTRPGIFGAWTAGGRARPPEPERVYVELQYVRNRSFASDLAILFRSIPVVLQGQAPEG